MNPSGCPPWIEPGDIGSQSKIKSDDQWQQILNDKWDERLAHIVVQVTARDGYVRNDSSLASKVGNGGIPLGSSVASSNHVIEQVASPNQAGFVTMSTCGRPPCFETGNASRNDSSVPSMVSNSDILPGSGVTSPNHVIGQVASSPNHVVGRSIVLAPALAPARVAPTLPDEILEDIFLRLHEAADLARASAVCSSFRRAACVSGFLRRYRALHPPPVLGVLDFYNPGVLLHAELPHRSASAARALMHAADFSFSFVPRDPNYSYSAWRVWDTLNGRVLLSMNRYTDNALKDLMVCDPLHRRYVEIPPIPGDLVPANRWHDDHLDFEPFLAPALEEEEKMHELSFRVICNVRSSYKVVTLVFSSVTANWRGGTSISFLPDRLINNPRLLVRYYVHGCFYWTCASMKHMLLLDPREMKLTLVELPDVGLLHFYRELPVIVNAGEDKLGVVTVGDKNHTLDLYCKTWWNNDSAEDWEHKIIPLPELGYECCIKGATDIYLLLKITRKGSQTPKQVFYILEVKALLFERLSVPVGMGYSPPSFFASFPPPLSPPTI